LNISELVSECDFNRCGISPERLYLRRGGEISRKGKFVLYWMQASQRSEFNPALEGAALLANRLNLPLITGVVLINNYPAASARHYRFMLEGWRELSEKFSKRGIDFRLEQNAAIKGVINLAKESALVVCDCGYTKFQEWWRLEVSRNINIPLLQIEGDVVVPVRTASNKEEYSARTIRPKIHRLLPSQLVPLQKVRLKNKNNSPAAKNDSNQKTLSFLLSNLKLEESDQEITFTGGENEALKRLKIFIRKSAAHYNDKANDPTADATSELSPYIHFGQISPSHIALDILSEWGGKESEGFLEQLIVRRELAMNFVFYNDDYDNPRCTPDWAVRTLEQHAKDKREYLYSYEDFAEGKTHDPAWNAAQLQMVRTGHMANYMRMYWGKKVLEWTPDWQTAYKYLVRLNDTYELDGRDPNGYTGIAWIFGKHDRAWQEREIFGKTRYMNAAGLKRKFDIASYIQKYLA